MISDLLRDDDRLAKLLLESRSLTEQEVAVGRDQAKKNKVELWRSLINLNLITIDKIEHLQQESTAAMGLGKTAPRPAPRVEIDDEFDTDELPNLVDQIFERAVLARATDIHFDPQDDLRLRIRLRIDGLLHDIFMVPPPMVQAVVSRIKLLASLNIIEKREAQDGHMVRSLAGRERNIRIASIPTHRGERLVARLLDEDSVKVGIEHLGFNAQQIEIVHRLLEKPYGIVIVTGPVGSGKTTTLYSCLHRLNIPTRNVMTIEDPVEYKLAGVNQLQVNPQIDWTFPKALRSMLRQDPNVMMIGEIRDDETAQIAVRASLTGILVTTSMHANDAASTIANLYNFGIPTYLICNSLLGVIAQRLVRVINPNASEEYAADAKIREFLQLEDDQYPNLKLRRGKGAAEDFGTGYRGRTGIFEVMEVNDVLRDMIFRETTKDVLRQLAIDMGMTPIFQHGVHKVIEGVTTIEELYRVSVK